MEETDACIVLTEQDESCGLTGPLQPSMYPEEHIKIQAAERKSLKNMDTAGAKKHRGPFLWFMLAVLARHNPFLGHC